MSAAQHVSLEFLAKIEILANEYGLGITEHTTGRGLGTIIKLTIDKASVEVIITCMACVVRDEYRGSVSFDKRTDEWEQNSLDYLKELLESYKASR